MSDLGTILGDSLQTLRAVVRELQREIRDPLPEPIQRLARLQVVTASLGDARPSKSLHCPEQYVQQWNAFLEDGNNAPERRAVRYLCWEPEIATSEGFQYYLDRDRVTLEARSLHGLIRSCHARWSSEFAKGQVVTWVRDRLERYNGSNRVLSQWKEKSNVILSPKGTEEFGAEMVQKLQEIKPYCESWKIADETCAYVQAAVSYTAKICRDQMDRIPKLREYLLTSILSWRGWVTNLFKQEVSQVVLHPAATQAGDVRESVRAFVLNDARLGDPRQSRNRLNWVGIGDAERRVIEWLSHIDIKFFFESVLPQGKDPHGRKDFWLRYVSRVVRSRPLLNWTDRSRLRANLKQKEWELLNFGSMSDIKTSAFLLDFGRVIAVEFSAVGNACYLYEKSKFDEIVPDFWMTKSFDLYKLKQRKRSFKQIIHRKARSAWHGGGWEEATAQILARCDIRPGSLR